MALNPIPSRGPLVQAGMDYFGGKEAVSRKKKKAKDLSGKAKLSKSSLSPVPQFRQVPEHLAGRQTSGLGRV